LFKIGTAVFILEAIVIALSLLAGLGRIGGPAIARIALGFFALFIIPGVSIERLVFRAPASALERMCRTFCMGLVFCSLVVCAGLIPGVSYRGIAFIASFFALGLAFLARAKRTGSRSMLLFAILFAICFFAFRSTGELGWRTDAFDHVSFVRRSVDSGVLFPRDSFYREGDGVSLDPRKGLWHPVLSLWTYQAHAPADRVWREIPAFIAFFAICSFLLFALELSGSRLRAALALALFFLFYGGEGIGWLAKLGFSRNIAQIALWTDLALLLTYYRTKRNEYILATFLVACVGTSYHVVFAMLLGTTLLAVFFYVTFLPGGREWRSAFWRSVPAQLAGMAIPLAVRAREASAPWNMIHTHLQGMLVFAPNLAVVDPAELAMRYGLAIFYALLMAPFFFLVVRSDKRGSLVFMLFIVPVILVLDPLIASLMERRIGYLHYRILDAAPLVVMLAVVVGGLCEVLVFGSTARGDGREMGEGIRWRARGLMNRLMAGACIALFILFPFRSSMMQLKSTIRSLAENREDTPSEYTRLFKALGECIPGHSVIATDPLTSYLLSAYTDHFVVVTLDQHGCPSDTSAVERLREARNLLSPAVALGASRPWLVREHADYVLLNTRLSVQADFFDSVVPAAAEEAYEKLLACPSLMSEVLTLDGFHLFRVHRYGFEAPPSGACAVARAAAIPCEEERTPAQQPEEGWDRLAVDTGTDVGCGIILVSLTVDNYMLYPGDTLRGHFCWRASQDVAFGLPLEAAVRINTGFPEGALYRDWYGKQYRRIVERRNGRFYRLTWRSRLMSGFSYPDMWETRRVVKQDFSFALSPWLAPGPYEVRIKVYRVPYLVNRSIPDYLLNDDSLQGVPLGMIYVQGHFGNAASAGSSGRRYAESIR